MAKELTKDERIIVRGYKEGLKNIRKDINLLYEKHAKDGKLSTADLSKYNRLTNLEKNIADNLKTAYDVQVRTTKKAVKGAFESAFYYGTFELEQETKMNLMFGLLKKEAVNAVVEGPNRWPQIAKGHTKLTNAKIRDQIMQGVVQGKDAGQVTKAIAKEMNIAASKACRIVRTETHRAQNQGSLDSYTEAYKKGVLIQKVWVATLDDRTRDSHRVMDGQVVEVYEDFIMPGDIKASAPGLSGSASGDINCRCTIRAEVVGFTPQARRARGDGIIPQQTYQQWAKSKGIPFNKDMADEVKKLLEARGASKVGIESAVKEAKTLKNIEKHQEEWYNSRFEQFVSGNDQAVKFMDDVADNLKKLVDSNDLCMRVPDADVLSKILDDGRFKTQFETNTSKGALAHDFRKGATEALFGADVDKLEPRDFEKYGYLGSSDLKQDFKRNNARQYGDIVVRFKKENLVARTTITVGDSLGAELIGVPVTKPSALAFPARKLEREMKASVKSGGNAFVEIFEDNDIIDVNRIIEDFNSLYFELQYHGDLGISDIASITTESELDASIVGRLKDLGIEYNVV